MSHPPLKTEIVYVFPTTAGEHYLLLAWRFINTYLQFPPLAPHSTTIVFNGGDSLDMRAIFSTLPNCKFLVRDNSGYDIGAFQDAAQQSSSELIVFFGASTYFKRQGWLFRMAEAFSKHGRALYGAMGHRGGGTIHPHIRTTAFAMPPELLNLYPTKVTRADQRYQFEHGENDLTTWVTAQGLKSWVVTFQGEYLWHNWHSDPNGYHQGNQSNLLAGDRLCEMPYYQSP